MFDIANKMIELEKQGITGLQLAVSLAPLLAADLKAACPTIPDKECGQFAKAVSIAVASVASANEKLREKGQEVSPEGVSMAVDEAFRYIFEVKGKGEKNAN